jgi:phosphoglycerol transferase MdoB-like AlkP superfamily enzyme
VTNYHDCKYQHVYTCMELAFHFWVILELSHQASIPGKARSRRLGFLICLLIWFCAVKRHRHGFECFLLAAIALSLLTWCSAWQH